MTQPPAERYIHGHDASVVDQHRRRTAEEAAAFLLPHLRPGMRVLDVGCGPGTITTGLARYVAPGVTLGMDVAPAILRDARAHAREQDAGNAEFAAASIYGSPFPDATFDVAYAHQVLQHLARPVDALREMARVVRPGGFIAVRDADYGTMVAWPKSEAYDRWLTLYHQVAEAGGGEADAGRRIPAWLRAAGLPDFQITASTWVFAEPASVTNWGESWSARVLQSAFAQRALDAGLSTPDELTWLSESWRAWTREPDAFFGFLHIEGLATRP